MAVSGYQNPLSYQMDSAFTADEEDTTPVTTTSLTDTQPISTTATTTQLPRSSLEILQSAGVQQAQRPAAEILKGVGVTSAKDVLRSMYIERPEGLLEQEGISAASILEDYRKEQAAFRQQQNITNIAQKAETDLRKKEEEYLKNYSFNLPQNTPTFQTKYGALDFSANYAGGKGDSFVTLFDTFDIKEGKDGNKYAYNYYYRVSALNKDIDYETDYIFLPEEFALRGLEVKADSGFDAKTHSVFNTGFLNKDTWDYLFSKTQPIDLSNQKVNLGQYKDATGKENYGRGFLFKASDFKEFESKFLSGNEKLSLGFNNAEVNDGKILGIAERNGKLVYVKDNIQRDARLTIHSRYIDDTGAGYYTWTKAPKDHGGVLGVFQDVGEFVAGVPFLPEIAALIAPPGTQGYVYASLKALQVSGSGGSPEDVLKAAAVAYATSEVSQSLDVYGSSLGESIQVATGVSATVANTLGNAVVNAGFNGFVAAATGNDVQDAMLTGAISGGLKANAADITNAVFGGADNVNAVAKTLNLSPKQTQAIFTGALASGTINSVVKNQNFWDSFKESLIVQGISQAGANTVANGLKGKVDPKALAAVTSNTRIMLQATARAAVRGEDIETAIARVAPYLQGRAIGQTINILTTKK
jgi:hypothetical protein